MASVVVSGVVLAAGPSRRFGDRPPKQLYPIGGEPLVRRLVGRVVQSKLGEVIVVVGKAATEVERVCGEFDVRFVRNPRFTEGQSLSVKLGLAAVDPAASAAMFLPADQPEMTVEVIDSILDCYSQTGGRIVVPTYRGQRGAPVLFDRSLFGALETIEGDQGGRQLFGTHGSEIVEVPLVSSDPLRDLDTPDDLRRLSS